MLLNKFRIFLTNKVCQFLANSISLVLQSEKNRSVKEETMRNKCVRQNRAWKKSNENCANTYATQTHAPPLSHTEPETNQINATIKFEFELQTECEGVPVGIYLVGMQKSKRFSIFRMLCMIAIALCFLPKHFIPIGIGRMR